MAQSLAEEKKGQCQNTCPVVKRWARITMLGDMITMRGDVITMLGDVITLLGNVLSPSPADSMHAGGKSEEGELRSQTEAGFVR